MSAFASRSTEGIWPVLKVFEEPRDGAPTDSRVNLVFLNRLVSEQGSSRAVMTFSMCDVAIAFIKMASETARELSSISARV